MRFKICRTSLKTDEAPCKRTTFEYAKLNPKFRIWFIEINTLEELMNLQKEVNSNLIINDGTIEIYDDYRE
jgi:hypothetical protein